MVFFSVSAYELSLLCFLCLESSVTMLNIIFSMMALERSALSVLFLMEILGQRKWPEKKRKHKFNLQNAKRQGQMLPLKIHVFKLDILKQGIS